MFILLSSVDCDRLHLNFKTRSLWFALILSLVDKTSNHLILKSKLRQPFY